MFTMLESNLGYGASYASPSCRGAEMDFVNQQVGTLSYSQMLRMSMEESTEGMGCSSQDCVLRSDVGRGYAKEEAYMGSSARQQEEGFAENDYDLTCLTLGRASPAAAAAPCSASSTDVRPSSTSPQPVSRSSTSGFTRTCKLCGTSKTPLWRSGPMGAKSLCNACGIRSNKAKKLSAAAVLVREGDERPAAGAAAGGGGGWACKSKQAMKAMKRKKAELEVRNPKMKKKKKESERCSDGVRLAREEMKQKSERISKQQQLQLLQEEGELVPRLQINLASSPVKTESSSCVTSPGTPSPSSTQRRPFPPISMFSTQVHPACLDRLSLCSTYFDDRVFAKDEEQAAFLLMALSCGLVLA